jgi:hypothetical protein
MSSTKFNQTMFEMDQVMQRVRGMELDKSQQDLLLAAIQKLQVMVSRAGL